jgi:superfamily II DNA or RNA helicase
MKRHDRLLIVHGTGSGKTLTSAYVALDFMSRNFSKNVAIFVTPAAVHSQFIRSVSTVLSGLSGVYFTTYDNLTRFLGKLQTSRQQTFLDIMKNTLVIADEAHYIREKTEYSRVFYDILKHSKKVLLMTGTPIQNGIVTDLLPYAKILNPTQTITPSDMNSFERYFECKVSVYKVPSNSSNFPRLLPTERINLPLTNNQLQLVSNERAKEYEKLRWTGREKELAKGMSGWAFNRSLYTYKLFGNSIEEPKFKKFLEIFKARPHKTIVFFKEYVTLNNFAKFLKLKRIRYRLITGKEKNKATIIGRDKPDKRIVYLLTSSAKEGLDFKGVRTVVFMDYPWVPSNYNQIVGRARRHLSHVKLPISNRNVKVYELAYTHGSNPTLNTRTLNILSNKRARIDDMMRRLVSVSIEARRCPGTSPSPARTRARSAPPIPATRKINAPRVFLRKNRVLSNTGNYAVNPLTGEKFTLGNLNAPLGYKLLKLGNKLIPTGMFTERSKRKPTKTRTRPKTKQFSPKRGNYGISKLFEEPRETARTLSLKRKR